MLSFQFPMLFEDLLEQIYFYQFDMIEYASTIEDAHKIGRRKGWGYHVYKLGV